MTVAIILFPPMAGGNHLHNLISLSHKYRDNFDNLIYQKNTVHASPGSNLKKEQFTSILISNTDHLLHGHFGEIMSFQNQIREITNKKFIIICVDNDEDRQLLKKRKITIDYSPFNTNDYFFGEQVFLYEPFMYHHYFDVPMTDIMNIPISEWFVKDITSVLARINYFLQIDIDIAEATNLHKIWYNNNFT